MKEFRKRSRKRQKEATKQAKKTKRGQETHTNTPCEEETTTHEAKKDEPDTKASQAKSKRKLSNIFHISPGTSSSSTPSRTATVTIAAASPPDGEDPFQDPIAASKRAKPKTEKTRKKKEKREEKRKRKITGDIESHDSAQDPFRDPEPLRLIDADDFRLESSEDTG